jgi:tRNA threonylcarbamoyladenosine biosynthesis protein TsaB
MTAKGKGNSSGGPVLLALETSGRMGSVAVAAGAQVLADKEFSAPLRHSAEIFDAIEELIAKAGRKPGDIEQVYVSIGPGSFTGLRIAVTIGKTMHLANGAKVVDVDTLDAIAENAVECRRPEMGRIGVILDAKRGQFFAAVYERKGLELKKIDDDCIITAEEFKQRFCDKASPIWLTGEGLVYYKDKFAGEGVRFMDEKYWQPKVRVIHKLGWQKALRGEFCDALELVPKYLQRPDVRESKK